MAWTILILAGLTGNCVPGGTQEFRWFGEERPYGVVSMAVLWWSFMLAYALKFIPAGTAYASGPDVARRVAPSPAWCCW